MSPAVPTSYPATTSGTHWGPFGAAPFGLAAVLVREARLRDG